MFSSSRLEAAVLAVVFRGVDEPAAVDKQLGKPGNILGTAVGFKRKNFYFYERRVIRRLCF